MTDTKLEKKNKETEKVINAYLAKSVISDFSKIPTSLKLSYVQKTPEKFIKYREIAKGKEIPYIPHDYAERVLNFISNFRWGSEKIDSHITEYEITKTKIINGNKKTTTKKVWEAMVEMKIWAHIDDHRVERYVATGHKMYENAAITRADAIQSAISKAYTKFARTFGVGANMIADEEKAYDRVQANYVEVEDVDAGTLQKRKEYSRLNKWIVDAKTLKDLMEAEEAVMGIGGALEELYNAKHDELENLSFKE